MTEHVQWKTDPHRVAQLFQLFAEAILDVIDSDDMTNPPQTIETIRELCIEMVYGDE